MNEQDLLKLKQKIAEAKSKASEYKGQLNHSMKQLKQDWNCTDIKQAQKLQEATKKDIEKLNSSINKGISEFEDKYYTEDE